MPAVLIVQLTETTKSVSVNKRRGDLVRVKLPGASIGKRIMSRPDLWGVVYCDDAPYELIRSALYDIPVSAFDQDGNLKVPGRRWRIDLNSLSQTTIGKLRNTSGLLSPDGKMRIMSKAEIAPYTISVDGMKLSDVK